MEKKFVYMVTETNVNGCGGPATVFVEIESPITGANAAAFQKCLEAVKVETEDTDTEGMVEIALKLFGKETGISCKICGYPYDGGFES